MKKCNSVTDAAFVHLKGIHTLNMGSCDQPSITDDAFTHLKGIDTLHIFDCSQLSSAVFTHLKDTRVLNIAHCPQLIPTDNVTGRPYLHMAGHTDAAKAHARALGYLA